MRSSRIQPWPTVAQGQLLPAVSTGQAMATHADDTAHFGASQTARELSDWLPSSGSPDADVLPELETLRGRSRDLDRNNGQFAGGVQTLLDNIVGPKFRLNARPNARLLGWDSQYAAEWARRAEALWRDYSESKAFSADERHDFLGSTNLMLRASITSGDGLALPLWMPRRHDRPWRTGYQFVEADRLSNPQGAPDTDTLRGGIQTNRYGAPQRYHIRKTHPGDYHLGADAMEWTSVRARTRWGRAKAIHLTDAQRPGQRRGVPLATRVLAAFKMQGHYQLTELQASIVNAKIAAFIESNMGPEEVAGLFGSNPTDYIEARNGWNGKLDSGAIIQVPVGDRVSGFTPARPATAFAPFMQELSHEIATGLNLPGILLTKNYSQVNYSSARAALLEAWRHFHARRQWLATHWANEVYALFIEEAVNKGQLEAPDFYRNKAAYCRAEWVGVGHLPLDPVKDATAKAIQLETGQITFQDIYAERGKDWEEEFEQAAREKDVRAGLGLSAAEAGGDASGANKQAMDAYGVGVRAGAITPQPEDEDQFRATSGLPGMSDAVRQAWDDDGKVRRPITLQSGRAFEAMQDDLVASEDGDGDDPPEDADTDDE